jgi:hypothetical protein
VQPCAQVAVCHEHGFGVVDRAGDDLAPGRLDDRGAAAAVRGVAIDRDREVLREGAAGDELGD